MYRMKMLDPIYNRGRLYLNRWRIIDNRWFGVYLHQFFMGDSERHLHNHPWHWFCSIILAGGYTETLGRFVNRAKITCEDGMWRIRPTKAMVRDDYVRGIGIRFQNGNTFHTIREIPKPGKTWTLFIRGKRVRKWGFFVEETGKFEQWDKYLVSRGVISQEDATRIAGGKRG